MAKILFIAPGEEIKKEIAQAIETYKAFYAEKRQPIEECTIEIRSELDPISIQDTDVQNADILVSRGVLAAALRKAHKDIPLVEMPVTTIDVINCVREIQAQSDRRERIAMVGFGFVPYQQMKIVAELCGADLVAFDYHNDRIGWEDLSSMIDTIARQGFHFVIGGVRTAAIARERGMKAVVMRSGIESTWPAITEAMHIARIRRTERERAARLEAILNHAHEGIIATDTKNAIIQMNDAAAEMLGLDSGCSVGTPLERVIPDPRVIGMMRGEAPYFDELLTLGKNRFVLTKTSIRLAEEHIGSLLTLQKVSDVQHTEIAIRSKLHHRGLSAKYAFSDIIGDSPAIKEAVRKAGVFARAPSNILITGETGTGKELFAQSIHRESSHRDGPFVAVNCAAIPENLMESELFGYEAGAFTGASKEGKAGFFELAHEGTVFLDEISEIPLNLQGKLLRVLQESEVMRLGSDRIIPVNVRIVCAVNKDLQTLVAEGKFRQDLFYRLAVLQLRLPSLRERGNDILQLADHFLGQYASTFLKRKIALEPEARRALLSHSWNGNIRELRNVCEQLVVLNSTGTITCTDVEDLIPADKKRAESASAVPRSARPDCCEERKNLERTQILTALNECGCNKTKAAERLGMDRTTLWRKLKEYGIDCRTTIAGEPK